MAKGKDLGVKCGSAPKETLERGEKGPRGQPAA